MGFSPNELFHAINLTPLPTLSTRPPLPAAFPSPPGCRSRGRSAFAKLPGTIRPSDYSHGFASHFTSRLIGSLIAMPLANRMSPPGVTLKSSVPCRPQTPWCDGWMRDAFASIVQARPCPIFGRPVHQWGSPLDYGPVLLLMPFGFHLTVDTLPSGCHSTERERRPIPLAVSAVSSCVPV
jgi:hypothetical protein